MILSPYFWLAVLISALVLFGSGYDLGGKHARNKAAADQREAFAEAHEQAIEQAKADQKTAQKYEVARETVRTVYVKVKEKVRENIAQNPDYANCSLNADGLRLYNARPGDAKNTTGSPDSTVPGSAGRTGWQTIDDSGKQPGAIPDVLRLPGTAQGIIGMGGAIGGTGTTETLALVDATP